MKKVKMLLMMSVVFALALVAFVGCGGAATTSHRGYTQTGSFTAVESTFTMMSHAEYRALSDTWSDLETDAQEVATPFIRGLSGGNFSTDVVATHRRQLRSVDMFGDTVWPTRGSEREERVAGQGYFNSQTNWTFVPAESLGTRLAVATTLGIHTVMNNTHGNDPLLWNASQFNAMLLQRWNLTGEFEMGGWNAMTQEAQDAALQTSRDAIRVAITTLMVPQEYRDLGFHWIGGSLPTFTFVELAEGHRVQSSSWSGVGGSVTFTRFIRQNITRIETYFAHANVRSGHRVEFARPMQWNAAGTDLVTSTVTILRDTTDHRLRDMVEVRNVFNLYDRGNEGDHWVESTYFEGQLWTIMLMTDNDMFMEVAFIINKPEGH
ncbi:MAG: hypothetical protein FWE22_02225 [Firmicutes bacterium]|nr:hypothetical protein [Bacillota bacterium]